MGNDTPLAVLSDRRPLLYSYFKQLFAQVTNPPIDSIREAVVMSVQSLVGSERNLLDETPEHARQLVIENPILRDDRAREPAAGRLGDLQGAHARHHLAGRRRARRAGAGARARCAPRPTTRSRDGANILILSDRAVGPERVADPVAARRRRRAPPPRARRDAAAGGPRRRVGRAAQRAERRRADRLRRRRRQPVPDARDDRPSSSSEGRCGRLTREEAQRRAVKAIGKGLLKMISKMGISTIPSYCGAQIFEAVGLAPELVERYFTGTPSRIGGIGLDELAARRSCAMRAPIRARTDDAAAGRRPLRVAARRRAPPVEPRDDRAAPARRARAAATRRTRSTRGPSTTTRRAARRCAACCASATAEAAASRSTRSSRRARSSSASRPARCRSARSRARRTRRSRSR